MDRVARKLATTLQTSLSTTRALATVAVVALVVLAGCAMPIGQGDSTPAESGGPGATQNGAGGSAATAPSLDETIAPALESPGPAPAAGDEDPPTSQQPDPEADRLGWEDGYWYNDPVDASADETIDGSTIEALVARAMARVEYVRGVEFEESVNVSVTSRTEFGTGELGGTNASEALRTFDNAKFQALFLVPVGNDSLEVQAESLNTSVGGYYDTQQDAIVIVADGEGANLTNERTLAHELVHALQDQHFDGAETLQRLRDAYNGRNGLFEGDANAVQHAYMARCAEGVWRCLGDTPGPGAGTPGDGTGQQSGGGNASDLHMGVYLVEFFPYATGPSFVAHLAAEGGWGDVDAAYEEIPASATEVIRPDRYGEFEPRDVELAVDPTGGWERVRPSDRPDYGRLGRSALSAMFAYTLYDDYNASFVVQPRAFLNLRPQGVDRTDPLNYDLPATRGWTGDRLHAYERDGDVASVWRLTWDSPTAAERFARTYRDTLGHWDADRVRPGTWRLSEESPFSGAAHVTVEGDTVTLVRAPTTEDLGEVYPGAR